jgi:uncharacterized DUF497 family protein
VDFEPGFEGDAEKDRRNRTKHDYSLAEAASVFRDPFAISRPDPEHSNAEDRFIIIGQTDRGRPAVVCYTERGDNTRIIGVRKPTTRERRDYEEK